MPSARYDQPSTSERVPSAGDPFAVDTGLPQPPPLEADPLVVRRRVAPGGLLETLPFLGAGLEVTWPVNSLPTARLDVTLAEGWGVALGEGVAAMTVPLRDLVSDDHEIVIETAHADASVNTRLFEGFVSRISAAARPHVRTAELYLVALPDVLRTEGAALVYGQLRVPLSELGGGEAALPRLYDGLDCVLNPNGRGNCGLTRLQVPRTGGGTDTWTLPVFVSPEQSDAVRWTWARWLLYLLAWPRLIYGDRALVTGVGTFTRYGFHEAPPELGDATGAHADLHALITERGYECLEPDESGAQSDPWARALLGMPLNFAAEAMNWADAWQHTCARAGIGYRWELQPGDYGEWRYALRAMVPQIARLTTAGLPSVYFDTSTKTPAQIHAAANVEACEFTLDYEAAANSIEAVGATQRFEVTLELVPGWELDDHWDVDAANAPAIDAALAWAGEPGEENEFAARYARSGSEHYRYALVGRLWGLNTYGAWDMRWRPWGPWTIERYAIFDLHLHGGVGDPDEGLVGLYAPRPRRFLPCLTGNVPHAPLPPLLETSADSGASWVQMPGQFTVSRGDLRVYLADDDLRAVEVPVAGADPLSLVEAYIRGRLRLRITASIEGDYRLRGLAYQVPGGLGRRERHVQLLRSAWDWRRRDAMYAGNSRFNRALHPDAPDSWADARDDRVAMSGEAARVGELLAGVRHRGSVQVPWIVWPRFDAAGGPLSGYMPGNQVQALQSELDPVSGAHWDWALNVLDPAEPAQRYSMIAAVRWQYRQDPPAVATVLELAEPGRGATFSAEVR